MNKYEGALRFFSRLATGAPIQQLCAGRTMDEIMTYWQVADECITKAYCEHNLVGVTSDKD